MPGGDTRRINGPSKTYSVASYKKTRRKYLPLLTTEGVREDGRKLDEIRPMYLRAGIVQKANGSSYIETSGTKLVCAVYGPRDHIRKHDFSSKGHVTCSLTYSPFSRKERIIDHNDTQSKELSSIIVEALSSAICIESYPKAFIDIYINVLEDNGNALSHAIIASSIALADAGIEMLDLVTSSSMVFNDKIECLDPTAKELNHPSIVGSLTLGYLPSLNQISCLLKDGEQSVDKDVMCVTTCIKSCLRVHSVMKDCLVESTIEKKKQELDET